jgi:hypothetical protein
MKLKFLKTWASASLIGVTVIFVLRTAESNAAGIQAQLCNVTADYALGREDYPAGSLSLLPQPK